MRAPVTIVALVGACGLCVAAAAPARASVPDGYGFGSRSAAMAGAVGADATDFSATYYNPAGLALADGASVAVGYLHAFQRLRVAGRDNEVDDVHGLAGGLVARGAIAGLPVAFGVGLHLPDDGISFLKARRQGVPRWELYDTRSQLLYLSANVAIRPVRWLALGGGIGYLSATRGSFGIRGRADVLSPYDSALEHEVDADLTAVRFPQAGVRLLYDGWGALGVTYRGESKLDLRLDALLEGIVDFAGIEVPLLYALEAHTVASFTPQQVTVALSLQRFERLSLNVDVTWMNWSAYLSPTAEIEARLEAEPPPGTPLALPDSPAPTAIVPPAFRDRLVPRFGVEWRIPVGGSRRELHGRDRPLVELPARIGYSFDPSPVPEQSGVNNLIDADRHTLTLGLGVILNRPFEELPGQLCADVHAFFSHLPSRTMLKDNPADFVGDYTAGGAIFGVGGTLGVAF